MLFFEDFTVLATLTTLIFDGIFGITHLYGHLTLLAIIIVPFFSFNSKKLFVLLADQRGVLTRRRILLFILLGR